jgi:DNA-binding Lrp family transcriptional regulator
LENVFAGLPAAKEGDYSANGKRHAFVFITAEPDSMKRAITDLKQVNGITELYPANGVYDIVAKASGESLEHLREVVLKNIKKLDSINSTLTLLVI